MNRRIKSSLSALPYREMLELSKEVRDGLGEISGQLNGTKAIAQVLSGLGDTEDTQATKDEKAILHSMFTRKKQITIQPFDNGFKIDVPAQGITIYTDDLRDGISQALDNLVALKVLS